MKEVEKEKDLNDILTSNENMVVLFYASWCPFCTSFLPVFGKYAEKNSNTKFLQVRLDDLMNPLWEKYQIEVVPTVLFFKGKKNSDRLDGVLMVGLNEEQISNFLLNI
jgi:thiol-disulfide isomerase/thioredoxin